MWGNAVEFLENYRKNRIDGLKNKGPLKFAMDPIEDYSKLTEMFSRDEENKQWLEKWENKDKEKKTTEMEALRAKIYHTASLLRDIRAQYVWGNSEPRRVLDTMVSEVDKIDFINEYNKKAKRVTNNKMTGGSSGGDSGGGASSSGGGGSSSGSTSSGGGGGTSSSSSTYTYYPPSGSLGEWFPAGVPRDQQSLFIFDPVSGLYIDANGNKFKFNTSTGGLDPA